MNEREANPAGVDVEVSRDRHVWTLEDWPITRLIVEASSVRLTVWKLAGSAEIRIGGRFRLAGPAEEHVLDPAETEMLAPALSLVGLPLRRIEVRADGSLELAIGERVLEVRPDPRFQAWDAQGAGVLDGFGYGAAAGDGP